jgi:ElaB/YqjD/DUF883 family membrane-anchored ribosome-binding protein
MQYFLKAQSILKSSIQAIRGSFAAFVCLLGIMAISLPAYAASTAPAVPTLRTTVAMSPPLSQSVAIFGLGKKAEGKLEEVNGKIQASSDNVMDKIKGTGKQIEGRAKYNSGRVEDAAKRTANKMADSADDLKDKTKNDLKKAKDTISDTADSTIAKVKDMVKK